MINFFRNVLMDAGMSLDMAEYIIEITLLVILLVVSVVAKYITDKIFKTTLTITIRNRKYRWHNALVKSKFFKRLTHFVPLIILYSASPFFTLYGRLMRSLLNYYLIIIVLMGISSFLTALNYFYNTYEISKKRPIKGFIQIVKIVIYCITIILVVAHLLGRSPLAILGSVGAISAILMLIFKDPIVGFVSGVQIASNDMIRIGDWIQMPKYNADGEVVDISLTTIKIENFDNSMTTVPTYAFISDSFINWRRMKDKGGRRIKRSILIDLNSIKFCDSTLLEKFKKIDYLKEYIESKDKEVVSKKGKAIKPDDLFNGQQITNISIFRVYIQNYLKNNNNIRKDMSLIVRPLEADEKGLPIEIYAYTNIVDWGQFESVQSDIFDHLLAIVPEFELELYQSPTGSDIKELINNR